MCQMKVNKLRNNEILDQNTQVCMIKNDRKKLHVDMDSADPQNRSEWRGRLRGRLVKKPNPR